RLAQDALDRAYRRGRAEPDRLVDDDPAVKHGQTGHSCCKMANSTVSRTWPVQVMRSARSTPSRTAPSFFIAACERVLRRSTPNSTRRTPEAKARCNIMSLTRRLKPVPRNFGR